MTSITALVSPATRVRADAWFASGTRHRYDPTARRMLTPSDGPPPTTSVSVFRRVVADTSVPPATRWLTMLPGFPDGSYGFAQVEERLGSHAGPRLYVEYIGQGDSDTPLGYHHSTYERADLVQAQWRAQGIRRTLVVAFDYSSLVVLELLRRQQERTGGGADDQTTIDAVFIVNGGLFADSHSHPWQTTPLLKTRIGRLSTRIAQRSPRVFDTTMRAAAMFSRSYHPTSEEMADLREAITRHDGAAFLHAGAGFVDEHRANASRWDLQAILSELGGSVAVHLAGSREDPFEPRQIAAARTRLSSGVGIRMFPGGHLTTSEHPELLADAIVELAARHRVGQAG